VRAAHRGMVALIPVHALAVARAVAAPPRESLVARAWTDRPRARMDDSHAGRADQTHQHSGAGCTRGAVMRRRRT
jgi:hypothetical protein